MNTNEKRWVRYDPRTHRVLWTFDSQEQMMEAAEAFCKVQFSETREEWGRSCADDFATDYDISTDEYIEKHGNPSDDDSWFRDCMDSHGFCVTFTHVTTD